ncbi:MAG TPA: PAS domain-containing sensor histidine kinase [Candidatus Binataceae bacterium]|nr:PAS domain-containing sensor histidine kinase [Candidatus Binataceae bacterium]
MKATRAPIKFELDELRRRLQEAEETLEAIRGGEVDALVVAGPEGERVFTLHGAEHPYRVLVESMNEGAVSLTPDGTILYCNGAFARMIDTPLDTVMGHKFNEFAAPEEIEALTRLIERGRSHAIRAEMSLGSSSGRRLPTQISLNPVELDGGEVIGVVVTDLSEQRHKEQAQEAVRLRDEFLSIASHELRTPLSTLILHLGLLERLNPKDDSIRFSQSVAKARGQADRMTELINRLLDVTRIASGKLELELATHDLGEIVLGIVEQMAEEARKVHCEFRLHIEEGIMARCDRFRLEQAIVNVISNALKYAPGRPISVSLERRGTEAVLAIEDRGVGIDPNALTRIFNRFERAASQSGGLGLGLYIAREIINQHGGSIRAERRRGAGSRFSITLPLSAKPTSS